jgi:hypothetical protein
MVSIFLADSRISFIVFTSSIIRIIQFSLDPPTQLHELLLHRESLLA